MPEQFQFLIVNAPERLRRSGLGLYGEKMDATRTATAADAGCVIVPAVGRDRAQELLSLARAKSPRVLLEVASAAQAAMAGELGFDGVVATAPVTSPVPVWGAGGIGLHSAAAWYAGGAAGVVLDAADPSWSGLAQRFRTVPAVVRGLRNAIRQHVELAKKHARLEPADGAAAPVITGLHDADIEKLLADGVTHVVFSGISDGRSAAMAAVLAAPLAEKGVRIG
ncbi:MAG TPA: hypothetical protein VMU80_09630, partial [Bryobacteraceae bacterium]|nr:hypothetical protein [Bryobacteraceae bacterium]